MSLVIDHDKLEQLKEYAESHRFTLSDLRSIQKREQTIPGDREEFRVFLNNYKVVYTIDETLTHQWVRHMSMSKSDNLPNDSELKEVCSYLGFKNFDECLKRPDPICKNAISVLEYMNTVELKLAPFGCGLLIEEDHNLLIKIHAKNPICVGYTNDMQSFLPLTPEKIEICKKLGITYLDPNL